MCICFSIIGSPFFFICVANLSFTLGDLFRFGYSKLIRFITCKLCKKKNKPAEQHEIKDLLTEPDLEDIDKEKETVPIMIAVLVIYVYIGIGSFLFRKLENWTHVQASYFSFIAIATIGFGDLVPGLKDLSDHAIGDGKAERNIIIAAIYLFFGIVVLTMCVDLIQEELMTKVTRARHYIMKCLDKKELIESDSESDLEEYSESQSSREEKI